MMYLFMTLNDDTEITHSEMKADGKVKVYIETPDERYCFKLMRMIEARHDDVIRAWIKYFGKIRYFC